MGSRLNPLTENKASNATDVPNTSLAMIEASIVAKP